MLTTRLYSPASLKAMFVNTSELEVEETSVAPSMSTPLNCHCAENGGVPERPAVNVTEAEPSRTDWLVGWLVMIAGLLTSPN